MSQRRQKTILLLVLTFYFARDRVSIFHLLLCKPEYMASNLQESLMPLLPCHSRSAQMIGAYFCPALLGFWELKLQLLYLHDNLSSPSGSV